MSDIDEKDFSSGKKLPCFYGKRGEDYGLWRHRLRLACRMKGVWNIVTNECSTSETTETTTAATTGIGAAVFSTNMNEKASAIIISTLGDSPLRVVMDVDDNPAKMLILLDGRYASNRTVSRIAVQTQLFRMTYNGQNMSTYVDQFTSLFSQLERMGKDAAISESHEAPMLLASINPKCHLESTAVALRTKDISDLTWDYVATTLIDEYNAEGVSGVVSGSKSRVKNHRNRHKRGGNSSSKGNDHSENDNDDSDSEIESTIRAFAAALKSGNIGRSIKIYDHHCDFCEKPGHTEDRCWLNHDNRNNKLPKKLKKRCSDESKVAFAVGNDKKGSKKSGKVEIAGSIVEKSTIDPPKDYRSYADSGATCHCFHSKSFFIPNAMKQCDNRTVMVADETSVTATEVGEVILPFTNANIRLKNVLHIPNLGYNLASTGRLADNGIESCFCQNDVRLTLESTGFLIGSGERDTISRMYMLPQPSMVGCKEHTLIASEESDPSEC